MKENFKGMCYSEDILLPNGVAVSRIILNYDCSLIDDANEYLNFVANCKRCSFNTIKVISYDICKFYDFLNLIEKSIINFNAVDLKAFIIHVKSLQVKKDTVHGLDFNRRRYSIENTIIKKIPIFNKSTKKNVSILSDYRDIVGLKDESIYRIFNRVIVYLKFLSETKCYELDKNLLTVINDKKIIRRYLTSEQISKSAFGIKPINNDMIFSKDEINAINCAASAQYEAILYYILENTGIRIGEALGIKIKLSQGEDIRLRVDGDIIYEDERWKIKVTWRPENPYYCRTKGHCAREIFLKKEQGYEFQLLLERYLKVWYSPVKLNKMCWMFESRDHKHLTQNTAYIQFKRTARKAGITNVNPNLHRYRHTFCTVELRNGVPIEFVSKMLGHKSIDVTKKIYDHMTSKDIVSAREKYEGYMRGKLDGN